MINVGSHKISKILMAQTDHTDFVYLVEEVTFKFCSCRMEGMFQAGIKPSYDDIEPISPYACAYDCVHIVDTACYDFGDEDEDEDEDDQCIKVAVLPNGTKTILDLQRISPELLRELQDLSLALFQSLEAHIAAKEALAKIFSTLSK
jgi:hypothetical protein